jgi:multidrug efflux pump subunit AcrA (membrane-fusion protein)
VSPGDTVCILEAPEIQNRYDNALKQLEIVKIEYVKSIENLKLEYLLLESQVRTLEASAKISELDSLQKAYVSDSEKRIIELEIEKSETEKQKLQNKLQFLKKINQSELKKLELRIEQSRNNVNRNGDMLKKLILTTPVEGLVEYAYNRATGKKVTEGDIIWNRRPILNIPDLSKMQVKISVYESDYKRIMPDQKVIIAVDAFPDLNLSGRISRKSPVGKPIRRGNPVKVFDIYATIDSLKTELQPGLSLTCQVISNEISDTICIPLTSLFESDSSKYVFLKKKRKFIKQNVETGNESLTHVIISNGLKENDIISLKRP